MHMLFKKVFDQNLLGNNYVDWEKKYFLPKNINKTTSNQLDRNYRLIFMKISVIFEPFL